MPNFLYSFLGLEPLSKSQPPFSSWPHRLRLLYNLALNVLILKTFFVDDPFFDEFSIPRYDDKPFLTLLLQYNTCLNYSLAHLATLLYYALTLHRIVALVDGAGSFARVEAFRRRRTAALVATLLLLVFAFGYVKALRMSATVLPTHQALLNVAVIFVNYLYIFLPLGLTHFIQFGTYRTMVAIAERAEKEAAAAEAPPLCPLPPASALRRQVRDAAHINRRLHRLNSLPMAVFIGSHSIVGLVCLSRFESRTYASYLFYIAGTFAYSLHIARLAARTRALLRRIIKREKERKEVVAFRCEGGGGGGGLLLADPNAAMQMPPKARTIELTELALYERYLVINLFTLCNFDYVFLACWALFLLNYTVLIVQTTTD